MPRYGSSLRARRERTATAVVASRASARSGSIAGLRIATWSSSGSTAGRIFPAGDTEGIIKLIFSAPDGKLLGAHVMGEIASELVHIAMACMYFDGDIDYFIHSVFNYPTLGDVYKYAAYDALGKLNRVRDGIKGDLDQLCAAANAR